MKISTPFCEICKSNSCEHINSLENNELISKLKELESEVNAKYGDKLFQLGNISLWLNTHEFNLGINFDFQTWEYFELNFGIIGIVYLKNEITK